MLPKNIADHLNQHAVPYQCRKHSHAPDAQGLAAALHTPGHQVAKTLVIEVDGRPQLLVLPATESLDEQRLAQALSAESVRRLNKQEYASYFPDCEPGTEPPFGRMFGLPVVMDSRLAEEPTLILRAGTHEEALEMPYLDYARLERPTLVDCHRVTKSAQTRRPVKVRE